MQIPSLGISPTQPRLEKWWESKRRREARRAHSSGKIWLCLADADVPLFSIQGAMIQIPAFAVLLPWLERGLAGCTRGPEFGGETRFGWMIGCRGLKRARGDSRGESSWQGLHLG